MYRALALHAQPFECLTCGSVIVDTIKHERRHAKRESPKWNNITVGDMKELLENFNNEMEIGIEVSGYEWDYARLTVGKGNITLPILEV